MHFILGCLFVYLIWRFRNQILSLLYSRFRSSRKDGSNALTFTHSALLTQLTDRERILFRDNVDHMYRVIKKKRGYRFEVDVRYIEALLNRMEDHNLKPDAVDVIRKVFGIISKTADLAPANLEFELTVEQIYIFLKDNI